MNKKDIEINILKYDYDHTLEYYKYVLNNALLNIEEDFEIDEDTYNILLALLEDYYDDCYQVSIWQIADAIINATNKYTLEEFLKLDYEKKEKILEEELMELF